MLGMRHVYHVSPFASTPHRSSPGYAHPPPSPWSYEGFRKPENEKSYTMNLAPCGRTILVHDVPDAPPIRTGHDGQRSRDERLGLTSAVLPA